MACFTSSRVASQPKTAQRANGFRQTARHDILEISQIRIHVQRKSMRCDPTADVDADCGYLRAVDPNALMPFLRIALSGYAEASLKLDQKLLHGTEIGPDIAFPFSQIENRITHNLPRAMICRAAASIGFLKRDSASH